MFSLREYRQPTHRLPDLLPWARLVAPASSSRRTAPSEDARFPGPGPRQLEPVRARRRRRPSQQRPPALRLAAGRSSSRPSARSASAIPRRRGRTPAACLVDAERRENFQRRRRPLRIAPTTSRSSGRRPRSAQRAPRLSSTRTLSDKGRSRQPRRDLGGLQEDRRRARRHHGRRLRSRSRELRRRRDAHLPAQHHLHQPPPRPHARTCPMYLDALLPDMAFTPGDIPMLGDALHPDVHDHGLSRPSAYPGILDDLNHLALEYRWVDALHLPRQGGSAARVREVPASAGGRSARASSRCSRKTATEAGERARRQRRAGEGRPTPTPRCRSSATTLVSFGYLTATVTVWDQDVEHARRKMPGGQAGDPVERVRRPRRVAQQPRRVARLAARPRLRERPPAARQHDQPRPPDARSRRCGPATQENEHLRERVAASARRTSTARTAGDDAVPPEPGRPGRRPHAHHRAHRRGQEHACSRTLAMQWLRYPGAQVIIFDKDRSARAATLAVGGTYLRARQREGADGVPAARATSTIRAERVWASQFVLNLLAAQRVSPRRPSSRSASRQRARQPGLRTPRPAHAPNVLAGLLATPELKAPALPVHAIRRRPLRPDLRRRPRRAPRRRSWLRCSRWAHLMRSARRRSSRRSTTSSTASRQRFDGRADAADPRRGVAVPRATRSSCAGCRTGSRRCGRRTSTSSSRPRRSPTPPNSPIARPSSRPARRRSTCPTSRR